MVKMHRCTHRWCSSHDQKDFRIQERSVKSCPDAKYVHTQNISGFKIGSECNNMLGAVLFTVNFVTCHTDSSSYLVVYGERWGSIHESLLYCTKLWWFFSHGKDLEN